MKPGILLIALLVVLLPESHSQALRSPDYYFSHSQVSQEAKDYYARLFDINQSQLTYSILDSAFTANDDTRPFYVFLICNMMEEAKGDLRTELNVISRHLAEQHPNTLTGVLFSDNKLVKDKYKDQWAYRMSVEIRVTCNSDLMDCFKRSRNIALQNCADPNKNKLEYMYNLTRKNLNLFQQ